MKLYHPAYADSKDPDQTAQPPDQGLRYPFSESLDVVECINQKRGGNFRYDFVDARDLKNCAFRNMLEDTVSLDTTNLHVAKLKVLFTVCNRQNALSNVYCTCNLCIIITPIYVQSTLVISTSLISNNRLS